MKTKREDESYDYSGFDRFFDEAMEPEEMISILEEMRIEYIELCLHIEQADNNGKVLRVFAPQNALRHSEVLGDIIKLIKSMK